MYIRYPDNRGVATYPSLAQFPATATNGALALALDTYTLYVYETGIGWVVLSSPGADGDVFGPASSTDNALSRFDGVTGKLIQNSLVVLDDSGNMSGINTLTVTNLIATTTISTGDNIILLNNDVVGVPTENAGLEVQRGSSTNSTFLWDETLDRWVAGLVGTTFPIFTSNDIIPIANGGSGQATANLALNAFLPSQGAHAGEYLRTDGSNTSWAPILPTTPGGSPGQIQYNNSGSFGGFGSTDGLNVSLSGSLEMTDPNSYITHPGNGVDSEKFGLNATADGTNSTVFGNGVLSTGNDSNLFGKGATDSGYSRVTIIGNVGATSNDQTSIGYNAAVYGLRSTAIGSGASAGDDDGVAIGFGSGANISGVAIGSGAFANNAAVAIGAGSSAGDTNALAIGPYSSINNGIAIGPSLTLDQGIAVASNSSAGAGSTSMVFMGDQIAIGGGLTDIIAIGSNINNIATNTVIIGHGPNATSSNVIAIGARQVSPLDSMFLGYGEFYTEAGAPQGYFNISPSKAEVQENALGTTLALCAGNGTGDQGSGGIAFKVGAPDASSSDPAVMDIRMLLTNRGELRIFDSLQLLATGSTNLTADNQVVTVGSRSHIVLSSNNATPTNRTFTLSNGLNDGQILIIEWSGTNQGEILATSNCRLPSTMQFTQYDTLTVFWSGDAGAWLQISRSANA